MNTPKDDRDTEFYRDAFCSASTWGPGFFEAMLSEHPEVESDEYEFFCHRANALWEKLSQEEIRDFMASYDDWLDQ